MTPLEYHKSEIWSVLKSITDPFLYKQVQAHLEMNWKHEWMLWSIKWILKKWLLAYHFTKKTSFLLFWHCHNQKSISMLLWHTGDIDRFNWVLKHNWDTFGVSAERNVVGIKIYYRPLSLQTSPSSPRNELKTWVNAMVYKMDIEEMSACISFYQKNIIFTLLTL